MDDGYAARFGLVERLLGAGALGRLRAAHVCVVGIGGVGSWAVEGLARSGVGAITLIDPDTVHASNINRQLVAMPGTVGRLKVDALAERVRLMNPDCRVNVAAEFFDEKTAERLLAAAGGGWVVDAVDRMSRKALLIAECRRLGRPIVTVGGAAGKRDPTRIRTGDLGAAEGDNLLRLVRRKLRRDHGFPGGEGALFGARCVYSSEPPVYAWNDGTCHPEPEAGTNPTLEGKSAFGTGAFVTACFGFAAAGEVVRAICGEPPPTVRTGG